MGNIADIEKDTAQWYQDVLKESEFIDYSPVKGCFVFRPYCYALWENIKCILDKKIKETGAQNAYFPLLIPESFIKKEAKHIEGFSPELAVVTYAGGKKLEEPLVIRPTSETIIYYMFAKWIKSWRDLPLKINQWANIIRWEMRTRPFLRSTEFLWQEGHTAHATKDGAKKNAIEMLQIYQDFIQDYLAIPVVSGIKSESERFAGADSTYCIESLMCDGKALQMGTTHILAQSFSNSFDIKFQDEDGNLQFPYCSSWGMSTRLIGAIILVHGDQNGLVMPPKVAPIKAIIVPIYKNDEEKNKILSKAYELKEIFCDDGIKVEVDDDEQLTPGAKFFKWELKGIPVRIEIGPKDIEKNNVVLVNRFEKEKNKKKKVVSIENVGNELPQFLDKIQNQMFQEAKKKLGENWYQSEKLSEFGENLSKEGGFYEVGWCGNADCEDSLKEFKASIRCLLEKKKHPSCFLCGKSSKTDILVAKAY
ncbi:proline--tRNA ligase [Candidatus Babeliales bacterium]|nr:proline--tRNA ligase [Candidatus Babeliales bacterium]